MPGTHRRRTIRAGGRWWPAALLLVGLVGVVMVAWRSIGPTTATQPDVGRSPADRVTPLSPTEPAPAELPKRGADPVKSPGATFPPAADADTPGPIRFQDVTKDTGITFRHTDGSSGRLFIVETVASGLATFDYDLDGLVDIYFVDGGALPGYQSPEQPRNRLYRNLGDWRFEDVTDTAGVGDTRHGLGATVGDFDNDGYPDLYVSNLGSNVLYRNNGDGTFRDVTEDTGTAVSDPERAGAGVCFLDMDGDGDLDLFVANYLRFSPDASVTHTYRGQRIYAGPERYPPYPNTLLRNNGDGTFRDVSDESGVGQHPGFGMGIVCGDFDQDGTTDVFVGNDGGPGNFIFRNDGRGVFEESGVWSGAAYSGLGLAHGSMGSDCADYDNDGFPDLFVTSYQRQLATLFRNRGDGTFQDVTQQTGAGLGSLNQVTWGCGLVDLDNDGRRDIFYACGHLIDNIDSLDDSTSYEASPVVLHQTAAGRFVNVTGTAGPGLRRKSVGRGVAVEDLDRDGRLDVVILNSRQPPTILRNDSPQENTWLQLRLIDPVGNRDAVGTRVVVEADGQRQFAEVHSGRGFQSHFGTVLHFGLGTAQQVERMEIHWMGGVTETLGPIAANSRVTVVAGQGVVKHVAVPVALP